MRVRSAISMLIVALAEGACGSSVNDSTCDPGQQIACACNDGADGAQVCKADGSGFDACVCESSSSSTGGGASSSSSSSSGGGGGAGGATLCTPGETMACYAGPLGTLGVGACRAGVQTCSEDGASWAACLGEVDPAVEDCSTPEDDECSGRMAPCGASSTWSRRFGDASDMQGASAVALDDAANVFITGSFPGTIDFGTGALVSSGQYDLFLAKLDREGATLWSRSVAGQLYRPSLAVDGLGNSLVGASISGPVDLGGGVLPASAQPSDVVLAKYDKNGDYVWAARWSAQSSASLSALTVNPSGEIILLGTFASTIDFGCGVLSPVGGFFTGAFVTKLSPGGDCLWSKSFGGDSMLPTSLAVDPTGSVYAAGWSTGKIAFGGGLVATGDNTTNVFLAKLSATGAYELAKAWATGNPGVASAPGLATDALGNVLLTGRFSALGGGVNFGNGQLSFDTGDHAYLVKLDGNGTALWSKAFGPASTAGLGVAVTPEGDVVATGQLDGAVDFGAGTMAASPGIYIAHFDADGNVLSSRAVAGCDGAHVAVDGLGNAVVAGAFNHTTEFGNGPLVSAGGADVFVADVGKP